ncbi:MAG: TIGR00341 family protein [Pirellulales bacterium]|nr:TIGR00341 family protein [Pirellulales bacterium]
MLVLVTQQDEVDALVSLAAHFADAYQLQLQIMCWGFAPGLADAATEDTLSFPEADALLQSTRRFIDKSATTDVLAAKDINIFRSLDPDPVGAVLTWSKEHDPRLLMVADTALSGSPANDAAEARSKLLRNSPSSTFILSRLHRLGNKKIDILLLASDSQHDATCLALAAKLVEQGRAELTVGRMEQNIPQATAVGLRDLNQLMRDSGVNPHENIELQVFKNTTQAFDLAEECDLVLVPAGPQESTDDLLRGTRHPTIGLVKQRPPLRRWRKMASERWGLSPEDYADLVQGLRRGSRATLDYFVMVAAATAIATLGLLQDSPAVVIGAMLVAPLMTPIVGCGLGLAQANFKLFRTAANAIFWGFGATLLVSFSLAWLIPGRELTAQVLARANPDLLDLLIALSSAIAAAYALARPSLVGAIAGVAIATALVPPLSCIGIALAYGQYLIAKGATLLFFTNMIAIVLGAACTFRLLGVTGSHTKATHRRWVYRMAGVLGVGVLLLLYPLGRSLERTIDRGKPQPRSFPLAKHVDDAIRRFVAQRKDVQMILADRPGATFDKVDVLIILASQAPLSATYRDHLIQLVRDEMDDPEAVVMIHYLREAWVEPAAEGKRPQAIRE